MKNKMKFSQRIGKTPISKQIQLESLDDDLKNKLWNVLTIYVFNKLTEYTPSRDYSKMYSFCRNLWHDFFKLPIDNMPRKEESVKFIKEKFYNGEWYETYDLLEYIVNYDFNSTKINTDSLKSLCNTQFDSEFSGYHFIGNILSPITNQNEIAEIENAINNSNSFTALEGVNIHLESALEKMSNKKNPDYRNSIKESISAIESVGKVLSEDEGATLGSALDKIKTKINLDPTLVKSFKQLYGYTSNSDGIRHALMNESSCSLEDAKYILISSSAFINYLIVKATKSGILINN